MGSLHRVGRASWDRRGTNVEPWDSLFLGLQPLQPGGEVATTRHPQDWVRGLIFTLGSHILSPVKQAENRKKVLSQTDESPEGMKQRCHLYFPRSTRMDCRLPAAMSKVYGSSSGGNSGEALGKISFPLYNSLAFREIGSPLT